MKICKGILIENIGLILYKTCLDLVYVFYICDLYGYYLTFKVDFELFRYIESWMLLVILILMRPRKETIASYFLLLQLVLTLIPMLSIYGLSERPRSFMIAICGAHVVQCILEKIIKIKKRKNVCIKQGRACCLVVILFLTFIAIVLTIKQYGIPSLTALNFSRIYEVRGDANLSGILAYIIPWFFGACLPFVIVNGIKKDKKLSVIVFIICALYFFLTYARKAWLLSAFFVIGMYVVVNRNYFKKACCIWLPMAVSGLVICGEIWIKTEIFSSLFVRRILFLPADIKFAYFNFFKDRPKLHFSEGLIGKIFGLEYPYDKRITLIIGDEMGTGSSCNTGYLADAYANLGFLGMFLLAVLLFVLLKTLDFILLKEDFAANFSILSFALFGMNDGALLTQLLTGGLALLMIFLLLVKRRDKEKISMQNG